MRNRWRQITVNVWRGKNGATEFLPVQGARGAESARFWRFRSTGLKQGSFGKWRMRIHIRPNEEGRFMVFHMFPSGGWWDVRRLNTRGSWIQFSRICMAQLLRLGLHPGDRFEARFEWV